MAGGSEKGNGQENRGRKSLMWLTAAVCVLFLSLAAYITYFLVREREEVISNAYNAARMDNLSDRITRGRILSSDGEVLAQNREDEEGKERRVYLYGDVFGHVLGYSTKGKTGLEELMNTYLMTSHISMKEKFQSILKEEKIPGDDVVTTLDTKLQQVAFAALGEAKGAVVAMEPETGRILAMVSKPGFDPNLFDETWEALTDEGNMEGNFLNRAIQGLYPPGSVFKIVTALAYLRAHKEDWEEYSYDCGGTFAGNGYEIGCYHGQAHGVQTFAQAFANSCNGAFADIGLALGPEKMRETAADLLFNSQLPSFEFPVKQGSFVLEEGAAQWEIAQTAIGQGKTQMTPMQCVMITAAIANKGILMEPKIVDSIVSADFETVKEYPSVVYKRLMQEEEAAFLTRLMVRVVEEGTASALRDALYGSAGKTGSAEFGTDGQTHAWFTGFAPVDDPKIAVTVLIEEGGSGGTAAAPVARALFDACLTDAY